jgi:hypothetical protein
VALCYTVKKKLELSRKSVESSHGVVRGLKKQNPTFLGWGLSAVCGAEISAAFFIHSLLCV